MEETINRANEIVENVTITNTSQLRSITYEQAKKIKSLRVENQTFDGWIFFDFDSHFPDDNLEQIYFDNCSFSGSDLWILSSFPSTSRIGFTRCGLRCASLEELLSSSNPYQDIEVLDLSGNDFENPTLFVDALKKKVFGFRWIKTLIISDNGFDPMIVPLIKYEGDSIEEVVL
jgi:hypothetical protein